MSRRTLPDKVVLDWLLEDNQPSVRYFTLADLLGRSKNDPERIEALSAISRRGWANDILKLQKKGGYWEHADNLYRPKYIATNWRLIVLSDLGLTKENPKVRKTCEL